MAGPKMVANPRNRISSGCAYSEVNPNGVAYLMCIPPQQKSLTDGHIGSIGVLLNLCISLTSCTYSSKAPYTGYRYHGYDSTMLRVSVKRLY
jgi:hypothetical protein